MKLRLLLTLAAGAISCAAGPTEPTEGGATIGVAPRLLRRRAQARGAPLALAETGAVGEAWGQQAAAAAEALQVPAPAPAPGPGGVAMPQLPAITQGTCDQLKGKVTAMECSWFSFGTGMGIGCSCTFAGSSCKHLPPPDMTTMGFTGLMSSSPISVAGMGGLSRITCFYQQWLGDPTLSDPVLQQWQKDYANFHTVQHMTQAFRQAESNALEAAAPLWQATPMPWLQAHPTTPHPMFSPSPGPVPMLALWDPTAAAAALAAQAAMMFPGFGGYGPSPGPYGYGGFGMGFGPSPAPFR